MTTDLAAACLALVSMAGSIPAAIYVLVDALRTRRAVQMLPYPNGRGAVAQHYLRAATFRCIIVGTALTKTAMLLVVVLPLENPLSTPARVFVLMLTVQHLVLAVDAWLFALERRALFRAAGR